MNFVWLIRYFSTTDISLHFNDTSIYKIAWYVYVLITDYFAENTTPIKKFRSQCVTKNRKMSCIFDKQEKQKIRWAIIQKTLYRQLQNKSLAETVTAYQDISKKQCYVPYLSLHSLSSCPLQSSSMIESSLLNKEN